MAQIFSRGANALSKMSIVGGGLLVAFVILGIMKVDRSPLQTSQGITLAQPVPFSHDHHTAVLGIHCVYCHTSVEESASAGIPPTQTCMNCHSQIWADSPMLEPVRESYRTKESIEWARIHDLPDFAYFNHSIHIKKGVGCETCHGPINEMPLVRQHATLQMQWCLDCHRNPENFVRPREAVFDFEYEPPSTLAEGEALVAKYDLGIDPPANQKELGLALVAKYEINSKDTCSTCHR
jgi:hypothetical protein